MSGPARRAKPQRRKRGGRGALFLIALMFLASGLLRLGDGTGQAIAREVEAFAHADAASLQTQDLCQGAAGVPDVLAALQLREERLTAREGAITDRIQALSVAERAYEQNTAALLAAEQALSATMARSETAAEDDLTRLTAVYENMKPKDAAALFEEMNPEFSAGFLGRMRPDAAASIMAGLTPQTAYTISVVLAGRNAGAPTE